MVNKKRWIVPLIIVAVILVGAVLALRPALMALGKHELYIFAREKNYCHTQSCDEGIAHVTALLQKRFGLAAGAVPWCMAANRIYFADFALANALKNKFADWMYRSCQNDNLTLDDANITIGEPHGF